MPNPWCVHHTMVSTDNNVGTIKLQNVTDSLSPQSCVVTPPDHALSATLIQVVVEHVSVGSVLVKQQTCRGWWGTCASPEPVFGENMHDLRKVQG